MTREKALGSASGGGGALDSFEEKGRRIPRRDVLLGMEKKKEGTNGGAAKECILRRKPLGPRASREGKAARPSTGEEKRKQRRSSLQEKGSPRVASIAGKIAIRATEKRGAEKKHQKKSRNTSLHINGGKGKKDFSRARKEKRKKKGWAPRKKNQEKEKR